jgi:cytochrome c peroxidase
MGKRYRGFTFVVSALVVLWSGCGADANRTTTSGESDLAGADALRSERSTRSEMRVPNRFGMSRTINASGGPLNDPDNPFFQSLGINGRSCSSCHVPEAGMTVTPEVIQRRFRDTAGLDPIFRAVDGSNSPNADLGTRASRREAFSLLLDRGLIRVGIGIPTAVTEFDLVAVDDPYGYASAKELSLFRRPPPASNLRFLSTVMWDGRETFKDPSSPSTSTWPTNPTLRRECTPRPRPH